MIAVTVQEAPPPLSDYSSLMPFPVKPPPIFLSCLSPHRSPTGDEWPFWNSMWVRRFWIAGAFLVPFLRCAGQPRTQEMACPANRPPAILLQSQALPSRPGLPSPPKPEEAVLGSALEELEVTGSKAKVRVTVYSWAGCTRWAVGLKSCSCFLHWVLCPGTELLPRRVAWASPGPP